MSVDGFPLPPQLGHLPVLSTNHHLECCLSGLLPVCPWDKWREDTGAPHTGPAPRCTTTKELPSWITSSRVRLSIHAPTQTSLTCNSWQGVTCPSWCQGGEEARGDAGKGVSVRDTGSHSPPWLPLWHGGGIENKAERGCLPPVSSCCRFLGSRHLWTLQICSLWIQLTRFTLSPAEWERSKSSKDDEEGTVSRFPHQRFQSDTISHVSQIGERQI